MSGLEPNFQLTREFIQAFLNKIMDKYEMNLSFMAPELREEASTTRNPIMVIGNMIRCIPLEEENRHIIYSLLAYTMNVPRQIRNIVHNWWIPMSNMILPQLITELETPWKKKMIDIWMSTNTQSQLQEPGLSNSPSEQRLIHHEPVIQEPVELESSDE